MKSNWKNKEENAFWANKRTEEMELNFSKAIEDSANRTKIYDENQVTFRPSQYDNILVYLEKTDSVSALFKYKTKGKTAILNFASFKNPGGGFMSGAIAQEEALCHASFLYNVLSKKQEYYDYNKNFKNKGLYINRGMYSPNILFELDDEFLEADIITCAAPNISVSRKYNLGVSKEENSRVLKSRIRFVLNIAADNQVDTLILGAFGCGVFSQDAEEVANIFMDLLLKEFKVFKKIIFAIPPGINYDLFEKVIKKNYEAQFDL